MGIDPGTTTLGISHVTLDTSLKTPRFTIQAAQTLKAKNQHKDYLGLAFHHGELYARLQQLKDQLVPHLVEINPHIVVCESPFMGKFAQSFAALVECLMVVRQAVVAYDLHLPIVLVDPTTAKKSVGVKIQRKMHKDHVTQALRKRKDLTWKVALNDLDEHSVDATAVALHYLLAIHKETPCRSLP
jgi:Holliday junction resolvasome RuvABC endonuclease subunit